MNISEAGLDLIKTHEGLKLISYKDGGGVWTIGFGHTNSNVREGMHITEEQADEFLRNDIIAAEKCISNSVTVEMTQGQFDGLCSFIYNLGCRVFGTSTLLEKLNDGDDIGAAQEFPKWVYDNHKLVHGLQVRRKDEMEMFLA